MRKNTTPTFKYEIHVVGAIEQAQPETVDSVAREMLATLRRARKLMPSYSGYFSYILDEMDDVIAKADKIVAQGGEAHGGVNVG